jgi:hypothetical protein
MDPSTSIDLSTTYPSYLPGTKGPSGR